jgi:hypothetical protein
MHKIKVPRKSQNKQIIEGAIDEETRETQSISITEKTDI